MLETGQHVERVQVVKVNGKRKPADSEDSSSEEESSEEEAPPSKKRKKAGEKQDMEAYCSVVQESSQRVVDRPLYRRSKPPPLFNIFFWLDPCRPWVHITLDLVSSIPEISFCWMLGMSQVGTRKMRKYILLYAGAPEQAWQSRQLPDQYS